MKKVLSNLIRFHYNSGVTKKRHAILALLLCLIGIGVEAMLLYAADNNMSKMGPAIIIHMIHAVTTIVVVTPIMWFSGVRHNGINAVTSRLLNRDIDNILDGYILFIIAALLVWPAYILFYLIEMVDSDITFLIMPKDFKPVYMLSENDILLAGFYYDGKMIVAERRHYAEIDVTRVVKAPEEVMSKDEELTSKDYISIDEE